MSGLTPEQIALRRGFIGGMDALAIVIGDWRRLWRIKTAREEPEDLSWVIPVQIGLATEDLNCRLYEHFTGEPIANRNGFDRHPNIPFLAANLDGIGAKKPGGEMAYVDFKWCARADEARTIRYTAQCTHCAIVIGAEWWQLSMLTGAGKWELIEQEVDPFFAQDYLARCEEFWGYVESGEEPPEDVPALGVPKPTTALRTIDLDDFARDGWPNWGPAMVESLGKWAATLAAHKAHEVAKREIKELLPEDVGTVTRGRIIVRRGKDGSVRPSIVKEGKT